MPDLNVNVPMGSFVCTRDPQLVALLGKFVEPQAWLEEVCHLGQALQLYSLTSLPVHLYFLSVNKV